MLHPTSLPGPYGIGDLGEAALRFVDFLGEAKQTLWQVLPLGPTGYGDSPYQSFSAFAGNPLLLSPDRLAADDLLDAAALASPPGFPAEQVDYGAVIPFKRELLDEAAERFRRDPGHRLRGELATFCRTEARWLDDYALFMALKHEQGGAVWSDWPRELATREPRAIAAARNRLADAITAQQLLQLAFARQWRVVKQYANERGIEIIGDVPIFVAYDSADVWAHRELFFLDEHGRPTLVAGVPPDVFSATGQLWGNPLYRWEVMAERGFDWWIDRLRATFALFDVARIDHFIGLTRNWAVPADAADATEGEWIPGPGAALIDAARRALGRLPIIAEDLGLVTPAVEKLRDELAIPGMKVLQFAFGGGADNPYLPHHHRRSSVVYTGTHDNDTTVGWFASAGEPERSFAQRYLARSGEDIAYDLIRAALGSVADMAIVPLQDVLGLGSDARMNYPGRTGGNWAWRFRDGMLGEIQVGRLADMTELYQRAPAPPSPAEAASEAPSSSPADRSR